MIMKRIAFISVFIAASAWMFAQEGHPLRGTWHGTYGPDAKTRTDVTLVMDWDGKAVSGIINPGLRAAPLQKTSFDPPTWMFHFESDVKDRAGTTSHVVIDAKIDDVTSVHRTLNGTWSQGPLKGDFKAIRDN